MAEKLQNAVKALLRSSEDVTIALQVHLVPENRTAWGEDDQERVLAVVKHRNQEKSVDEGRCVQPNYLDLYALPKTI